MDKNNAPIPCKSLTSRQVTDSLARCKAKAIAMCSGVGMSLFLGFGGDGGKARSALGVQRDTDLSNAKALTSINGNGNPYVSWSAAVAAARVTDPAFEWEVEESKVLDWHTGEDALRGADGRSGARGGAENRPVPGKGQQGKSAHRSLGRRKACRRQVKAVAKDFDPAVSFFAPNLF